MDIITSSLKKNLFPHPEESAGHEGKGKSGASSPPVASVKPVAKTSDYSSGEEESIGKKKTNGAPFVIRPTHQTVPSILTPLKRYYDKFILLHSIHSSASQYNLKEKTVLIDLFLQAPFKKWFIYMMQVHQMRSSCCYPKIDSLYESGSFLGTEPMISRASWREYKIIQEFISPAPCHLTPFSF